VQERGWRKEGRKRVGRLYIAAIVEGKGSRGMEAGVDGATPISANAQTGIFGGGGGRGKVQGWRVLFLPPHDQPLGAGTTPPHHAQPKKL
jgi:hypothetical protein